MAFFSRPHSASAAVKIVNPNSQDDLLKPQSRKDSVQRQCRNVMIYGSCKYQDKGCVYYHPPASAPSEFFNIVTALNSLQAQDAPQFTPRSESPTTGSLTAQAVNAPVFVPKSTAPLITDTSSPPPMSISRQSSFTSPSPPSPAPQPEFQGHQVHDPYDNYAYNGEMTVEGLNNQMEDLDTHFYDENGYTPYQSDYDPNAMEVPFFSGPPTVFVRQPLNYHLYTPAIPTAFVSSSTDSHFIPPSSAFRELLQSRSETIRGAPPIGLNLPDELQGYHTLVPLEGLGVGGERRKFGNWYSTVYRAINSADGAPYALRRVENYRMMHQAAFTSIEAWSKIRHPNIVSVCEAFTTRAFNDNSLVVAYAYHANAQTLFDVHLKFKAAAFQPYQHGRSAVQAHTQFTTIPERTIWSYIIQIACAIKKVHDAGQAVRMIDVTKVLLTGKNRIRISSCGIVDVLMYDAHQDVALLQQEDLAMFGRLLLALCCNNVAAANGLNVQKSLEMIGRLYSGDVKNVALFLIGKGGAHRNIGQLFDLIGNRLSTEMDDAQTAIDRLEGELTGELENARLVRLLCKFGFINERPEFAREPRWSETGDRYIIKLFRDYVFHQIDENNNPVVNLSHVLTCLNKLDAGTDEKIMLVARDDQSCLVVSYKEIKSCIDSAFGELARGSSSGGNTNNYR